MLPRPYVRPCDGLVPLSQMTEVYHTPVAGASFRQENSLHKLHFHLLFASTPFMTLCRNTLTKGGARKRLTAMIKIAPVSAPGGAPPAAAR